MKQFFKKKFSVKSNTSERVNALTTVIDKLFVFLAQYLNRKAVRFRPGAIAFILLTFCVIGVIAFSLLGLYAFKADSLFQIQPVRVPAISKLYSPFSAFDYTIKRIHQFHNYMDSLHSVDPPRYDSILRDRPRLMDSVAIVEKLIHE